MPITASSAPQRSASKGAAKKPKNKLVCMEDIDIRQMNWLWHPYLPMGASVLMHGPGGVGKSHIICDIAARISRGDSFPFEVNPPKRMPGRVLLMSAEDEADVVLKPNLLAAGANMRNVFVPESQFIFDEAGIKEMAEFMSTCQAVACFIDPIVAYMGAKKDMFRANEVREVMGTLNGLARKLDIAMIIVGHDRKNKEGSQQDLASGSADFVNAPRGAFHVVEDKYGTAMWHVKSNYSAKGPALAYEFKDNVFKWTKIRTEKEPVFGRKGSGGAAQSCEAFIRTFLEAGPRPAKEVEAAAEEAGLNMGTLNRVKKDLGIKSYAERVEGKLTWFWALPAEAPAPEGDEQ
jgi:hypothetical protein